MLDDERFDVVHLHEPMTPRQSVSRRCRSRAAASFSQPGTPPASSAGCSGARRTWGFLAERIDARIAVSEMAAASARRWLGGDFEIIPNGVLVPPDARPQDREHHVVFIGRHEARKGLPVLLRAWPEIRRATGARLRLIGTDPLQYRLLHSRLRFDEDGIDVLGIVPSLERDRELATAKLFVSPALGGESFGMVLA